MIAAILKISSAALQVTPPPEELDLSELAILANDCSAVTGAPSETTPLLALRPAKEFSPVTNRVKGGSRLELLERMIAQNFPQMAGQSWPPSSIQSVWRTVWESRSATLRECVFRTTCDEHFLSALPPASHTARVAFLAPKGLPPQRMACVVHLAGTLGG